MAQVESDLARYEKLRRKKDIAEDTYDAALAKETEAKAAASGQAAVDQAQLNRCALWSEAKVRPG